MSAARGTLVAARECRGEDCEHCLRGIVRAPEHTGDDRWMRCADCGAVNRIVPGRDCGGPEDRAGGAAR